MADGLCSGGPVGNVIEKTMVQDHDPVVVCETNDRVNVVACENVNKFYINSASDKLFDQMCGGGSNDEEENRRTTTADKLHHQEGFLRRCEDDCRKKRCVDRYDSSESSDSGVAVLSCTDCSGSSTASSDITDPGSPFSTTSSHSEDSGSQPAKMPPTTTQTAHHHQPWPWTATVIPNATANPTVDNNNCSPLLKRSHNKNIDKKTAFITKRHKSNNKNLDDLNSNQSPSCLINNNNNNNNMSSQQQLIVVDNNNTQLLMAKKKIDQNVVTISPNDNNNKLVKQLTKKYDHHMMQQGKITEYFKSQVKVHVIKKSNIVPNNLAIKSKDFLIKSINNINSSNNYTNNNNTNKKNKKKFISLVDQQTQFNGIVKSTNLRGGTTISLNKKCTTITTTTTTNNNVITTTNDFIKNRNNKMITLQQTTVPRKILPAPTKLLPSDNLATTTAHHHHQQQQHQNQNHHHNLNNLAATFPSTVTLTALSFPPNLTYLHTKSPKPPDQQTTTNIFVPQFATITTSSDKIHNGIPIINRTSCLNVIQPVQKLTTINNFNCVKLNATVVPIVKLNTLPSRLNGSTTLKSTATTTMGLSVDTALPTILTAKPKTKNSSVNTIIPSTVTPKQYVITPQSTTKLPTSFGGASVVGTTIKNRTDSDCNVILIKSHRIDDKSSLSSSSLSCSSNNSSISSSSSSPTTTTTTAVPISTTTTTTTATIESLSSSSDSGLSYRDNLQLCIINKIADDNNSFCVQQKSPILSQPKTIRFPAKQKLKDDNIVNNSKGSSSRKHQSSHHHQQRHNLSDSGLCRWAECNAQFDTSGALLEHLQVKHVISQATQEQYVCLWLGCKVHGRTSCSRSWLERHVLAHAGTKPFRCIVDGCGQRFNSQLALERHVNGHFSSGDNQNGTTKKSTDTSTSKLYKRNGKKIRFRRQPWSARMFDFFDSGVMEGLQHKLLTMTQNRTLDQTVSVSSEIMARRVEPDGKVKFLIKWHPADIISDEWISEKEFVSTKVVSIPSLKPSPAKDALKCSLFPQNSSTTTTNATNIAINNNNNNSQINNNCRLIVTDHQQSGKRLKHRRKPITKKT